MTNTTCAELVSDLEATVSSGSPERRVLMLQRVLHLFLSSAARLNETQIGVFDDVMVRLIEHVEAPALVHLSAALAASSSAPQQAVRRLACHKDIAVAGPVLLRSSALSDAALVEIASRLGRQHLLTISCRRTIGEALTDILLKRGDLDVCRALAKNAGAKFSEAGYAAIVAAAEPHKDIADSLVLRPDLPAAMLRELLSKATDAVRLALLKSAPPKLRQSIREVLDDIAAHVSQKATEPVVYSEAHAKIAALSNSGKLTDSVINRFAMRREATNVIVSLSVLSGAPIEVIAPLMEEKSCDGLIVACRASRLDWQTALSIIRSRSMPQLTEQERTIAKEKFEKLYLSTAQQTIRFGLLGSAATKPDATGRAVATAGAER
ncbi:DUF2336 domain-containing protein [Bradyrhizobium sp. dw_411]|uniref:DUF2336 domain-containing protein n=1 Tax=Bradyrhizobium sp. dw_411 TaxID=2720082 RepID=UPI001BD16987|nr:DUF2336 domain-containing protein [Bradyrhizobium sp. dw_411]